MPDDDIPQFRKGLLLRVANTLGLPDDAAALAERNRQGLPCSEEFLAPIVARINDKLTEGNDG